MLWEYPQYRYPTASADCERSEVAALDSEPLEHPVSDCVITQPVMASRANVDFLLDIFFIQTGTFRERVHKAKTVMARECSHIDAAPQTTTGVFGVRLEAGNPTYLLLFKFLAELV